jgi:hypothetical protein
VLQLLQAFHLVVATHCSKARVRVLDGWPEVLVVRLFATVSQQARDASIFGPQHHVGVLCGGGEPVREEVPRIGGTEGASATLGGERAAAAGVGTSAVGMATEIGQTVGGVVLNSVPLQEEQQGRWRWRTAQR